MPSSSVFSRITSLFRNIPKLIRIARNRGWQVGTLRFSGSEEALQVSREAMAELQRLDPACYEEIIQGPPLQLIESGLPYSYHWKSGIVSVPDEFFQRDSDWLMTLVLYAHVMNCWYRSAERPETREERQRVHRDSCEFVANWCRHFDFPSAFAQYYEEWAT